MSAKDTFNNNLLQVMHDIYVNDNTLYKHIDQVFK